MLFPQMTDEEIDAPIGLYSLLKPGLVDFVITDAEEKISEAGNPMLVVNLECSDSTGKSTIKDYIVFTEKSKWKVSSFFKSIGLRDSLKQGMINVSLLKGMNGICEIGQEEVLDKKTQKVKTYNKIKRYVFDESELENLKLVKKEETFKEQFNDDVPF